MIYINDDKSVSTREKGGMPRVSECFSGGRDGSIEGPPLIFLGKGGKVLLWRCQKKDHTLTGEENAHSAGPTLGTSSTFS